MSSQKSQVGEEVRLVLPGYPRCAGSLEAFEIIIFGFFEFLFVCFLFLSLNINDMVKSSLWSRFPDWPNCFYLEMSL